MTAAAVATFPNEKCYTLKGNDSYTRHEITSKDVIAASGLTVIFSVPDPYTRVCTEKTLKGAITHLKSLQCNVVIHSVSSPHILASWISDIYKRATEEDISTHPYEERPIQFLADPHHVVADKLNITVRADGLGDHVCRRAAYVINEEMEILWSAVEDNLGDYDKTEATKILAWLDENHPAEAEDSDDSDSGSSSSNARSEVKDDAESEFEKSQ